jgi:hypothetical protein
MLPTLREGDRLLVLHGGRPRPGRLVVVRLPAYGGAGDPAGDGSTAARPAGGEGAAHRHSAASRKGRGCVVAVKRAVRRDPDGWWVERDNPLEGVDSWAVGAVPEADVIAVVLCRGPRALARGAWGGVRGRWQRVVRHIRVSRG